jgi:hypothetical protein
METVTSRLVKIVSGSMGMWDADLQGVVLRFLLHYLANPIMNPKAV